MSGANATGVINDATLGGSLSTGVGKATGALCVSTRVVLIGGPPPIQPAYWGGGKVKIRSIVSSLGTPGPATVAPLSCNVTGTHWCQVQMSLGALAWVNHSHFMSVQAGPGAMPEVAQTAARTIPGGTSNFSGMAASSSRRRRDFSLGFL